VPPTLEEADIDDGDEILAIEILDLTDAANVDSTVVSESWRKCLEQNWTDNPREAKKALEDIFDVVLKHVLRQYELREKHFECVIRSKDLEILLSKARAAEQKQIADGEKTVVRELNEENGQLKKEVVQAQAGHSKLIEKLAASCKDPSSERTQHLFASLRDELDIR